MVPNQRCRRIWGKKARYWHEAIELCSESVSYYIWHDNVDIQSLEQMQPYLKWEHHVLISSTQSVQWDLLEDTDLIWATAINMRFLKESAKNGAYGVLETLLGLTVMHVPEWFRPGLGTVACMLGSRIASQQISQSLRKRSFHSTAREIPMTPYPSLISAIRLSMKHLGDFLKDSENVHKLLLKYAIEHYNEHPGKYVNLSHLNR